MIFLSKACRWPLAKQINRSPDSCCCWPPTTTTTRKATTTTLMLQWKRFTYMHDRMYIHTCTHTYIARHFFVHPCTAYSAMALQHWRFSDLPSWLPSDLRFWDAKPFINSTTAALRLCLHTCCRASQTRWPTSCKTMEEFHKRLKYFRSFSMSFSCFSCPISITPSPKWTPVPSDFSGSWTKEEP